MSSGSTDSHITLRHVNGVPVWKVDILTLRDFETTSQQDSSLERRIGRWLVYGKLAGTGERGGSCVQTSRC